MQRDTVSGLTLIFGSISMLVTMALHPTGGSVERIVHIAAVARGTHGLALASVPLMFFGFWGLTRRLRRDAVFAPGALVTCGCGFVAVVFAGVLNGFVAPAFAEAYADDPGARAMLVAVLKYNFLLNGAFAKVYMVAAGASTVLWSIGILRTGALARWAGWLGCGLGALGLVGVLGGFLGHSVHDFGLFILGLSAWTIAVGALLCGPSQGARAS